MKKLLFTAVSLFLLCGCGNKTAETDAGSSASKPRIYELADVDKELKEAGIELESPQQGLRDFFKAHPNYQVCQDNDMFLVARMRNSQIDPKVHDMYITAAYRDGKIFSMEVGAPEFSVANPGSYCH